MHEIIQSVADHLPSIKSIYDATLMYGIVHGIYKSPAIWRWAKRRAHNERRVAKRQHYDPAYQHADVHHRECDDGKCAML